MTPRPSALRRCTSAALLACGVLLAAPSVLAAPPKNVPLGHHRNNFQQESGRVSSSGWDPAFRSSENADKTALINELASRGISTFPVGLPGSEEPNGLRPWPFPSSDTISDKDLSSAGFPTISLSGVSGTVYLINGYSNCGSGNSGFDGCPNLNLGGDNTKVVISHSAFGAVVSTSGSPDVWIVDSLIDGLNEQAGGLKCQNCDSLYVMYSEVLGGDDGCKLYSDHHLYRTHIHAPELQGSEHADGCQCSGPCKNIFLVETNMDFLFRKPNAGYWLETTFGDAGPVYTYRNLLAGGQNPTRIVKKLSGGDWVASPVYKDNIYLGKGSNVSWTTVEFANGGSTPISVRASGNVRADGTSVQGMQSMPSPTAADDAAVANVVSRMDTWVAEIRAQSGVNAPPVTQPPASLTAPTLLP